MADLVLVVVDVGTGDDWVGLGETLESVVGGGPDVLLSAGLVVGGGRPPGESPDAHPQAQMAIMPATSSVASGAEVSIGHSPSYRFAIPCRSVVVPPRGQSRKRSHTVRSHYVAAAPQ